MPLIVNSVPIYRVYANGQWITSLYHNAVLVWKYFNASWNGADPYADGLGFNTNGNMLYARSNAGQAGVGISVSASGTFAATISQATSSNYYCIKFQGSGGDSIRFATGVINSFGAYSPWIPYSTLFGWSQSYTEVNSGVLSNRGYCSLTLVNTAMGFRNRMDGKNTLATAVAILS